MSKLSPVEGTSQSGTTEHCDCTLGVASLQLAADHRKTFLVLYYSSQQVVMGTSRLGTSMGQKLVASAHGQKSSQILELIHELEPKLESKLEFENYGIRANSSSKARAFKVESAQLMPIIINKPLATPHALYTGDC
jgi:hypothetical protein